MRWSVGPSAQCPNPRRWDQLLLLAHHAARHLHEDLNAVPLGAGAGTAVDRWQKKQMRGPAALTTSAEPMSTGDAGHQWTHGAARRPRVESGISTDLLGALGGLQGTATGPCDIRLPGWLPASRTAFPAGRTLTPMQQKHGYHCSFRRTDSGVRTRNLTGMSGSQAGSIC